ncbi:MAG: hypothetical protein DSY89_10990 [Deltaproteobacteria bacterium]|nr:MAG: hypothetical protein DSY89_10990 [Deltaproteobacteria bacterium]
MQKKEKYQDRLSGILQAVALETPDRVPVVLEYAGFAAHVTQPPMVELLGNSQKNLGMTIEAWRMVAAATG